MWPFLAELFFAIILSSCKKNKNKNPILHRNHQLKYMSGNDSPLDLIYACIVDCGPLLTMGHNQRRHHGEGTSVPRKGKDSGKAGHDRQTVQLIQMSVTIPGKLKR